MKTYVQEIQREAKQLYKPAIGGTSRNKQTEQS